MYNRKCLCIVNHLAFRNLININITYYFEYMFFVLSIYFYVLSHTDVIPGFHFQGVLFKCSEYEQRS